uniref:Uncharacterized protein n=1 Tax=Chrysotila carterae TaxID=13221 RepID=A0A7S4BQJ5_CHRCT
MHNVSSSSSHIDITPLWTTRYSHPLNGVSCTYLISVSCLSSCLLRRAPSLHCSLSHSIHSPTNPPTPPRSLPRTDCFLAFFFVTYPLSTTTACTTPPALLPLTQPALHAFRQARSATKQQFRRASADALRDRQSEDLDEFVNMVSRSDVQAFLGKYLESLKKKHDNSE